MIMVSRVRPLPRPVPSKPCVTQGGITNANGYFSNARRHPSSPLAHRAGSSSRLVARASDVDYDAVPSPRLRKSSLRRSSIGLPLPLSSQSLDVGGDVPFDDDPFLDEDGGAEEVESPRRDSRLPQTPRRAGIGTTKGNQDGDDAEDEIVRGMEDVEMQQEDEDEEATPTKKPTEKRPRKKRVLPEIPCTRPFAMTQSSS
jgi:centromere protein C